MLVTEPIYPILAIIIALVLYVIITGIFNIWFHPLANFPGPKFAAATKLYEFYYDVIKGGQFFYEIQRMHAVYGPIVRINPSEIHINDPDYYETVYSGPTHPRDKYDWFTRVAPSPTSSFATRSHDLHRLRRSALNPFFSRRSVIQLEPVIHEKVELLCEGLARQFKLGMPFDFAAAYTSLTLDTITHYSMGSSECWNCLIVSGFSNEWREAIANAFESGTIVRYIPWAMALLSMIPYQLMVKVHKPLGLYLKCQALVNGALSRYLNNKSDSRTKGEMTIFSELQAGDLQEEERRPQRLTDEGFIVVIAGAEALAELLSITTYHLLDNPKILEKLKAEVKTVMPEPDTEITWTQLEQLPYLNATIQEGLRISAIVTSRLPRIPTNESLQYGEYEIPQGTPVSMTSHFIHLDPNVYPQPLTFDPDRWTHPDQPTPTAKASKKYFVPFSKGTRACVGQNLAHAQAFIALAKVFRRFDFELYETTRHDVTTVRDCFNGKAWKGTKGVRGRVVGVCA